jgi:threonine dehydratase
MAGMSASTSGAAVAEPVLVLADVLAAQRRVTGRVRRTPVVEVERDGLPGAARYWLKLEYLQHTGSFKARGATNRILAALEAGALPEAGVVAASGGNAGLAVAYAARAVGARAEVFVPTSAPAVKVAKLRALGAEVIQVGTEYAVAYDAACERRAATGALLCHAYDQPEICAGQGTVGLELLDQVPDVETVVVAVGGGGLMAGITTAVHGSARVVGVEPEAAPTLHAALAAGRPVDVDVAGVAADSLGARRLGDIAFAAATATSVTSVLVPDDAITRARQLLWDRWRIVVEHGAATAIAALLDGAYRPADGERVAVVLCGANTDPADLGPPAA